MPVFPSGEWMDAFCAELVAHPRAPEAAARMHGVYRFVVEPGGPLADRYSYEVSLAPADRGVRAHRVDGTARPRVTVATDYGRWRRLLEGRLDVVAAVLFGHLRVSGDTAGIMRSRGDVGVLVEALREVETVWLDQGA